MAKASLKLKRTRITDARSSYSVKKMALLIESVNLVNGMFKRLTSRKKHGKILRINGVEFAGEGDFFENIFFDPTANDIFYDVFTEEDAEKISRKMGAIYKRNVFDIIPKRHLPDGKRKTYETSERGFWTKKLELPPGVSEEKVIRFLYAKKRELGKTQEELRPATRFGHGPNGSGWNEDPIWVPLGTKYIKMYLRLKKPEFYTFQFTGELEKKQNIEGKIQCYVSSKGDRITFTFHIKGNKAAIEEGYFNYMFDDWDERKEYLDFLFGVGSNDRYEEYVYLKKQLAHHAEGLKKEFLKSLRELFPLSQNMRYMFPEVSASDVEKYG